MILRRTAQSYISALIPTAHPQHTCRGRETQLQVAELESKISDASFYIFFVRLAQNKQKKTPRKQMEIQEGHEYVLFVVFAKPENMVWLVAKLQ